MRPNVVNARLGAAGRLMILVVLAAGCSRGGGEPPESEAARPCPVVEIEIDSVRLGSIPEVIRATGSTRALRQENVSSPVDGKVQELRVIEGDRVRGDDVLAIVETKESVAGTTGAELLLARARTDEERRRLEADLERARRNAVRLEVRAPFAGAVASRGLNQGEFVSAGGTLVTLVDLSSLCFVARLPVRELHRVQPLQEADIVFEGTPGRPWRCQVQSVQPQIDAAAQVAEVRLRFLEPTSELRADLFGSAEIVVRRHDNVMLVPDRAVLRDDETGTHTVVEAAGDTLAVVRPVQIGIETPDTVEIWGGAVRPGMHVVIAGNYALPDSTRLRVHHVDPPLAAGNAASRTDRD